MPITKHHKVKEGKTNPKKKIIELVPKSFMIDNLIFNSINTEVNVISPQLQGTSKYLCTYPHSLWFWSKETPLLSNTNNLQLCSWFYPLTFFPSPWTPFFLQREIHRSPNEQRLGMRESTCFSYVLQLPFTSLLGQTCQQWPSLPCCPSQALVKWLPLMVTVASTESQLIAFLFPHLSSLFHRSSSPWHSLPTWMFLAFCPRLQTKGSTGQICPGNMAYLASTLYFVANIYKSGSFT